MKIGDFKRGEILPKDYVHQLLGGIEISLTFETLTDDERREAEQIEKVLLSHEAMRAKVEVMSR